MKIRYTVAALAVALAPYSASHALDIEMCIRDRIRRGRGRRTPQAVALSRHGVAANASRR